MATLIAALKNKYDGLTASNFPNSTRPPFYFDDAALNDGSGDAVYPPYVICHCEKGAQLDTFEETIDQDRITLEVYANSLGDAETTMDAIRFNGSSALTQDGLDYGTLPDLTDTLVQLVPDGGPRRLSGIGKQGQRVHMIAREYLVQAVQA